GETTLLASLEGDRIVVTESLFFHEGSHRLRLPESAPVLEAVFEVLEAHPEIAYLLVEGHTNDHGGAALNYDLAERRARAVVEWLVARGVDRHRLLAKGFGYDRPLAPHDDPYGIRANRRVEFTVLRADELPD